MCVAVLNCTKDSDSVKGGVKVFLVFAPALER